MWLRSFPIPRVRLVIVGLLGLFNPGNVEGQQRLCDKSGNYGMSSFIGLYWPNW